LKRSHALFSSDEGQRVRSALAGRSAPWERSGDFVWTGELVDWMTVAVLKTDEGATFALAGILERPLMELHVGVVVEQDVHRLDLRALEFLPREHGAMTPREVIEVGATTKPTCSRPIR
jgi:hypothetical protein